MFSSHQTRKIYWALVAGVPRVKQGRVSTYLAKGEDDDGDAKMVVAKHGDDGLKVTAIQKYRQL